MEIKKVISYDRIHYKRNLLLAVIFSEALCISAFLLSPDVSEYKNLSVITEPIIWIYDIPPTVQRDPIKKIKPPIPDIFIAGEIDAFDILEDVELSPVSNIEQTFTASSRTERIKFANNNSAPRLTLEVLPDDSGNRLSGSLNLSLKVDVNGKVIDHRVLLNSIECADCLDDIIAAAYKSKWVPARLNGLEVMYWVEKSYVFN
jgi:hypothetical protein